MEITPEILLDSRLEYLQAEVTRTFNMSQQSNKDDKRGALYAVGYNGRVESLGQGNTDNPEPVVVNLSQVIHYCYTTKEVYALIMVQHVQCGFKGLVPGVDRSAQPTNGTWSEVHMDVFTRDGGYKHSEAMVHAEATNSHIKEWTSLQDRLCEGQHPFNPPSNPFGQMLGGQE